MAAPQRQYRNYLPNWARAHIRRGIEALPVPVQQYLPVHDLKRSIRAHPEQRDALDPGWRERAGHPAPTPADIRSRTQYISLEKAFAEDAFAWQGPRIQALRANQRAQLAAALYDFRFEDRAVFRDLYTGVNVEDLHDQFLIQKMNLRLEAASRHVDLEPLFPTNAVPGPDNIQRRQDYAAAAQRGIWDWFPNNGDPIPFGLPEELFRLIGRIHNEPPPRDLTPRIDDAVYDNLPAPQAEVDVEGDDPIAFAPFENGDPLLIAHVDDRDYIYKRDSLQNWLNARRTAHEPWTNPSTGLEITIDNLRRATARVVGAAEGGRRRTRLRTRRTRRRTRRRHTNSGRRDKGVNRSSRRAHR